MFQNNTLFIEARRFEVHDILATKPIHPVLLVSREWNPWGLIVHPDTHFIFGYGDQVILVVNTFFKVLCKKL